MAQYKCPKCKQKIDAKAEICPYCQTHFSPEEVRDRFKGNRYFGLGCLGLFALIFFAILSLAMCSPEGDVPKSAKAASAEITDVQSFPEAKHTSVDVSLNETWSAAQMPVQAAIVLGRVGQAIKAGASDIPPQIETMTFLFMGPIVDSYGNDSQSKVLQFTVKTADLKKINYDKVMGSMLLDFVYDIGFGGPTGEKAVAAYCSDDENRSLSPHFCNSAF